MSNVFVLDTNKQPLNSGSKTTGLALVHDGSGRVVFAAELTHRGQIIKEALAHRRGVRRSRRQRHTRYRKPRFKNRRRPEGWLAPSLESGVCNIVTWVKRLMSVCPITDLSLELVKFDMQAMETPEISGVEYQRGTLAGYELREYLPEVLARVLAQAKAPLTDAAAINSRKNYCRRLQRADGYGYQLKGGATSPHSLEG